MVLIENIDEFKRITKSKFGFIVHKKENNHFIHSPDCKEVSLEIFIEDNKGGNFFWFSTYSLAEKEFIDLKECQKCQTS